MGTLAERLKTALPFPVSGMKPGPSVVRIDSADPTGFWADLIGAIDHQRTVVLIDPSWPEAWKRHAGTVADSTADAPAPRILVATSGSTGLPKFCSHDTDTLMAAAEGYSRRFGAAGVIHAVNVLPQHHVGGLMPVFRAAACGGKVHFADYRDPGSLAGAPFPLQKASLSVVPTQLRRLLKDESAVAMLRRFALIFVGGAACPSDLLQAARRHHLRLAPCYGATETAAMVTAMDPKSFLAGAKGVGTPMPHARIEVDPEQRILVHSPSLLREYLPPADGFQRDPFATGDLGAIDTNGHLHIHGRADRVIITGGEKVHPEQVEAAALATGMVTGAHCNGIPDTDWGTRVELEVLPSGSDPFNERLFKELLSSRLPRHALPKGIRLKRTARVSFKDRP